MQYMTLYIHSKSLFFTLTAFSKDSPDASGSAPQLGFRARIENQVLLVGGLKIVVYKQFRSYFVKYCFKI